VFAKARRFKSSWLISIIKSPSVVHSPNKLV